MGGRSPDAGRSMNTREGDKIRGYFCLTNSVRNFCAQFVRCFKDLHCYTLSIAFVHSYQRQKECRRWELNLIVVHTDMNQLGCDMSHLKHGLLVV